MSEAPIILNLSKFGGPEAISVEELTHMAVRAKSKVKDKPKTGWSLLSHHEIIAMAWLLDLLFEDVAGNTPPPAKPEPAVISHV